MDSGNWISASSVITLISFLTFIGILVWAYSGRRKKDFDEAANLPFVDDEKEKDGENHHG